MTTLADQIGRVLNDRYRVVAPIGAGASAQVFLADDTRLRRRVAIKLLHAGLSGDEGFLRRFRAEAQAAAALNHPNIVAVYDWGEDRGTPYLVTEYLAGGSLRGVLDRGYRLTPSQALLVGLEATRALDHAHKRGFVHRDIKPANLLFGEEGRLRVADFGLARALAEAAWTEPAGAVVGTARYASPEQVRGESVDGRADVYALTLVLIEAVTGRVPFAADTTIATLMARVDKPMKVPDALGPLQKALARAGRPEPEERPDAGEFAVGLMAVAEELTRPDPLPLVAPVSAGAHLGVDRDPTSVTGIVALRPDVATPVTVPVAPTGPVPAAAPTAPGSGAPAAPYDVDDDGGYDEHDDEAPRRRRRWPKIVFAVLLLAILGVAGVLGWQALAVPSHEVPALTDLRRAAAEETIDENGWAVEVLEQREDGTEAGDVFAQSPPPGEQLKEGETVTITVSLGQELRPVPSSLAGATLADATVAIESALLTVGPTTEAFDDTIPAGAVVGVEEGTPTELETGSPVPLLLSKGPRLVPEIPAGSTFDEACSLLATVELTCARVDTVSDTVPAGTVIGTAPAAGSPQPRDTAVQVSVSSGPPPLPDVSGRNIGEAATVLQDAGYPVVGVQGNPFLPVTSTSPPAGQPTPRGTGVVLVTQ
ncbi:MAG: protein kinase [Acidimicrobiia bacterium]|nr:protein kinase [Acidimicrobiia bacterium]